MREGWTYKKLGEVASFTSGSRPSGGVRAITHGVLSLGGEHIGKNGYVDLSTPKYVSEQYYIDNIKGHLRDGDILLCKDGALSGKVALVRNELQGVAAMVNEHVFIIRTDAMYQPFLFTFLFSSIGQTELKSRITGAAQGGINGTNLKTVIVPIPPLSEQQRIVSELDLLSSIIEKKKAQLKEYDQLSQSIFYDMFGDPVTNEKGWEIGELQSVYRVTSSKRILQTEWLNNGVPFYKVADIVSLINGNNVNPTTFIRKSTYDDLHKANLVPKKGDILVTSRGTLGQCYIIKENDNFYFQDGMITWLSQKEKEVSPIYIRAVFSSNSFSQSLLRSANSSTVAYISINQLSKKSIPLPPLFLQQSFAEKIEAIERQKALIQQSITEAETLFNSRMDYYFN